MPVTITIRTIPLGSQLTSAIVGDEKESKNDFKVRIVLDGNGTGFEESDITLSTGASLVELTGSKSVWEATIRPPVTAGMLTITIGANAFTEGNAETTHDIRVSTNFPDTDAVSPTLLFDLGIPVWAITLTPTEIIAQSGATITRYTHDGTAVAGAMSLSVNSTRKTDYINGDILLTKYNQSGTTVGFSRRNLLSGSAVFVLSQNADFGANAAHTRLGYTDFSSGMIRVLPFDFENEANFIEHDISTSQNYNSLTHQDNIIYLAGSTAIGLAEVLDDDNIGNHREFNITVTGSPRDIGIYRDTLYLVTGSDNVFTLDIRPYRPLTKNTKTTIYPVFATNGDTLPLSQFCPDAKDFTFSVGFDKPTYLSINADNELEIASNAVTETQPVLIKLTGINYIDSVDFSFYLIIVPASSPTWRDVESLSMKANTTYDLHQIVDADSIAFEPGETQPTGSSISNGIFTIGTTGGTAYFRATKGGLTTDKAIQIDVIQPPDPDNFSDIFRFKVEIAGVDVTADLLPEPPLRVSKSLDAIELTRYRAGSVSVVLRNPEGKYNPDLVGNFWAANNLNPGGYQEEIKIYRESFVNGMWLSTLLFVGIIENQDERFSTVQATITARDISVELERSFISDFGTLSKWARLRQLSDEASYEGVYLPEGSLSPIQPKSGKAWSDKTALTLRQLQNPSKGPPLVNTGYLTTADFRTSGGFLENPPLLNFKAAPRSEDVRFLINQLALNGAIYNTNIQLIDVELDNPTVFNRGSVLFSVEDTRITRLLTDWVYDSTNDRLLMLLSNPEGHIADLLVQYNVESDNFRTLYTFDKNIKAHRIERRNATNYYILTSAPIPQDRSAATFPRVIDTTAYAYDSVAEGSVIRIHRYNTSTNTLTEHVPEDDDRPPQLGIHYHVGFENALYIDEFEGIVADYRGSFKFQGGNLYYRYAKDDEFGIASVDTSGTTTGLIDQTTLNYHNHLNFAFDVASGGDLYFVYAEGDGDESSLVIKRRTSAGVESTILTDTQDLDALTTLDDVGGSYLGAHECLFHDDTLYMLCPIQRVDYDADADETTRSREKAAGLILCSCNVMSATPTLTVVEKYDFATHSACNLIVHGGAVHYTEQPIAASKFLPINSSL